MRHTPHHYAAALHELTDSIASRELENRIGRFAHLLRRERATNLLPRIIEAYEHHVAKAGGKVRARVESAAPLSAHHRQVLAALFDIPENRIDWHHAHHPELLAGVHATIGDRSVKSSLAQRLKKLRESLV